MVLAPITCAICNRTEPFTIGWKLYHFHHKQISHNICFECIACIEAQNTEDEYDSPEDRNPDY